MTERSLAVLDEIVREKPARENRLREVLKDPVLEHGEDWFMCVPACFNETLDIKQTQRVEDGKPIRLWTQGAAFSFKAGDTLYDTRHAYKPWSQAIKDIALCIQVVEAHSAGSWETGTRYAGAVSFSLLFPNKERTRLVSQGKHELTQDEFVRFLIAGPWGGN